VISCQSTVISKLYQASVASIMQDLGPHIEHPSAFPQKTNVRFTQIVARDKSAHGNAARGLCSRAASVRAQLPSPLYSPIEQSVLFVLRFLAGYCEFNGTRTATR
jgi:hypothetical protein